jgi:hypothetical protein
VGPVIPWAVDGNVSPYPVLVIRPHLHVICNVSPYPVLT